MNDHKPAAATYTSLDEEEDGYNDNSKSSTLYRHVKARLQKELQKAVKDWEDYNDYDPFDAPNCPNHKSRKWKAPPSLTTMMITSFHRLGSNIPATSHVG